ncbi:MAG: DinB family protein [Phycisphaerae bacterium]|nr:DinB family protein [Phycisphaerae bacterium]
MSQTALPSPLPPVEPMESFLQLPTNDLVSRYRRGLERFDRRIFDLSDAEADQAFLPDAGVGRWSVRILIGHLADAELAFTHRMRRAVAEQNPVLALWDEDAFIDAGLYGSPAAGGGGQYPLGGFVAVIHTLRRWTAEWLQTLMPDQWERQAMHPERGPESVRSIAARTTWHLEHHARYLNAKVCRILGPDTGQEPAPRGGCGPNCGCGKK